MTTDTTQQHTPGPWKAIDGAILAADGSIVVNTLGAMRGSGDTHADEALIAAAPDLLEALEDAEFLLRKAGINWKEAARMSDSFLRSAEQARAAIAKAKGGED